jgi:hypothetical protein
MSMRKARLLLPLVLLLVAPITAQVEHAATPAQCRADADSWSVPKSAFLIPNESEFNSLAVAVMHDPAITARTLLARNNELQQCVKTDNVQAVRYSQASRAYSIAQLGRMADFITRHQLEPQFLKEDDDGQR